MDERQIARAALDETDANLRATLLDQLCGTDGALRERVEALMRPGPSLWGNATIEVMPAPSIGPTEPEVRGRLGPYEVESILGRGGMGTVYLARDARLDRKVAVKVLKESLAHDPTAHERFLREARAAAAVSHPHIVTIYSVEDSTNPYLVMEYVAGRPLSRKIEEQGPLDPSEIVRIGAEVSSGLAAAHERGVIHRDITPGNILLQGPDDTAKLADFGLARASNDARITATGAVAGTPLYMSPEQARGEDLDARSDLFSLGSVLYTMAAGSPPFRADSAIAVLHKICELPHPPLEQLRPGFPNWLARIIDRLLAKDPADRFQTTRELATLLAQYRNQLERTAEDNPVKLADLPEPVPKPAETVRRKPASPPRPNPRRPRFAVVVGLLGMAAVFGYLGWRNLDQKPKVQRIKDEPVIDPVDPEPPPSSRPNAPARTNPGDWGKLIDPLGSASSVFDDRGLKLNIPGDAPRDLRPLLRKNLDAARMSRPVAGDFTMEVRIDAFPQPTSAASLEPGQPGFQSAGLLIWIDPLNMIRFERTVMASDDPRPARIRAAWYADGLLFADHHQDAGSGPTWLQVSRTGRRLQLRTSTDGRFWSDFQEQEHPGMGESIEVGVAVANTTDRAFAPRFEGWKISGEASTAR